jgi:hypothetical protein
MTFTSRSEFNRVRLSREPHCAEALRVSRDDPPMRFLGPTTLPEASSDPRRAYLTRLRCVYRVSHPLDALLHSQPLRPCFMPVTPLGFYLQSLSLVVSRYAFRRLLPFLPSPTRSPFTDRSLFQLLEWPGSKDSCTRRVRSTRLRGLPLNRRPILSWLFPLRGCSPRPVTSCFHEVSSHGLGQSMRRRTTVSHVRSAESQRAEARPSSLEPNRPP